jgi:hypothetical protein
LVALLVVQLVDKKVENLVELKVYTLAVEKVDWKARLLVQSWAERMEIL